MSWEDKPPAEPRPHDPCFCESGEVYQDCHKKMLRYYVLDHPALTELWDVLAYTPKQAADRLRETWKERTAAWGPETWSHLRGLPFEDGEVRLSDE